jgi:methylmalonyl-CoA/ethylmalonyl-CoA epimerase
MTSTATASLGISKIGQIAVPVQDVPRAEAFYRDVLGLRHLFSAGPALSFFDCAGTRLMLDANLRADGKEAAPSSILYFLVPDLKAAFAHLEERGAQIVDPPHLIAKMPDHELWMGFFKDSEGNLLSLMAEVR